MAPALDPLRKRLLAASPATMRAQLLLLVVVTALPLAALLGYQVARESSTAIETAEHVVQDLAGNAAIETEVSLKDMERIVRTLAARPRVVALDAGQCDPLFGELGVLAANTTVVASFDAGGKVVCSSFPKGRTEGVSVAGDPWFRSVMDSGALVVGAPQKGAITQRWVSMMAVPIREPSGGIVGVLGVAIDLANFHLVRASSVPPAGVLVILDRGGIVVSRSPDAEDWIGRDMSASTVGRAAVTRSRVLQVLVGNDGTQRVYSWHPVGDRGWVVIAGVPTNQFFEPLRISLWRNGLGFLLASAVIALLVFAIYRRISRPLLGLRAAALAVAGGDLTRRAAIEGPREVTDVAASFNHMMERMREVEVALREREDQYRRLFLASPEAICVVRDGRVLLANPAAMNLFGGGAESATVGREFLDFVHPDHRARTSLRLQGVLALAEGLVATRGQQVGETADANVKFLRANGDVAIADLDMLPFAIGSMAAVMTLTTDVTRRRQLEDELQDRRDEVERLVNRQVAVHTTLAIAHELNQPLGAVAAYCEAALFMLKDGNPSPEQLRLALERGVQQAHRAGSSLHELVEFLHHEEALPESFDLAAAIRDALQLVRTERYNFDLKLDLAADLPLVRGRRAQVVKAIVNLLHNAVEATSVTGAAGACIMITAAAAGDMAQVGIQDSGPGLTEDAAKRLFTAFFTTKSGGMGLGLVITRALVEAQGGQLWYDTSSGQTGAAFTFTIPLST